MYLKKLEINGFKSFAKKTTLEFTSGITAVVGPNGSGKSNVADALRWVMGEQSIKTLRGKKSEDVIFSGSDKKARLGLAEVTMELDNSDHKVPLDYSELTITRRLYRNGDSDYLINNSKSKLTDINLLLTQANFGHRTYAIIGQGMIDNFLIATPEERKDFFDEATGVKQYQIKKNQTLNKLQQVSQNLITANIKLQEMIPQLNLLTRQVKKFNRRKELELELKNTQLSYYSAYWQGISQEYNSALNTVQKLDLEKNSADKTCQNLAAELDNIAKNSSLNQEIEKLRLSHQSHLDKKMHLRELLFNAKNSISTQHATQVSGPKTLPAEKISELHKKIIEIQKLYQEITPLFEDKNNLSKIKNLYQETSKKISFLIETIQPYLPAQNSPASHPPFISPKIKELEEEISTLDTEAAELQSTIKKLLAEDESKRSSLWQVQQKYQLAQQSFNAINNQLNEAKISLARVETKRFNLNQEILQEFGSLDSLLSNPDTPSLTPEEHLATTNKINRLKGQLEIIGGLDPEIEAEYKKAEERYNFLNNQINDLNQTIDALKKIILDLEQIIKKQLAQSFEEINTYFQKYFKILFNGGYSELSLVKEIFDTKEMAPDTENSPAINFFQEKNKNDYNGIEIYATPPGKKLKSINILSGGERALTSIALICAIISSNPAPFVVLDEVDAALDESNSLRFAQILEDLSHKTQFIVITHNRATMEKAKLLYGVTMGDDGISKLISIKLENSEKYIKNQPSKI